ncbi:MAG: DUF5681 domain-containing protein, partial [Pseudolabrys sp.]
MVFKPGKSGNPSGKPKGARNKTTVAMEKFDMPEIKTPSDALVAATAIMRAVAGGDLTPSEAAELSKTI